jgi:signal transduction histidine kinase
MSAKQNVLPRSFWYSVLLFIVFNSLFLAWVLFKPGPRHVFVIGDDIGQAIGWLLGTFLCFVGIRELWQRGCVTTAQRLVPVFLAAGIFCQFIGQLIYTYYDIHNWPPFPSWADIAYLSTFPFLMVGILLLPVRRLSGMARSQVMLDSMMMMTAIFTFSWYFVLGPTMLQGYESNFAFVIGSAYPFFDLILIFCILRFWLRFTNPVLTPVVRLLSVGLLIIVITDSIYDYQTLQMTYANGWQDIGWPIGYMLIGLAAQAYNRIWMGQHSGSDADRTPTEETLRKATMPISSDWRALRPYAFILAVILLTLYVWHTGANSALDQGVYWGGAVLIAIVLLRQLFAIRETIFYNRELRKVQQELHRKNEALSEANRQLEEQTTQVAAAYEQQRHLNDLKDQFLLNVNHELRTPLTEIHGYLNLLTEYREQIDEETQITFLDHAVHGCEELLHLVNNVLEAIRGDVHEKAVLLESLCVGHVVQEVLDLFEPQKRQQHVVKLDIPEHLAVKTDQQYLRRVLLNLLSNAFKYSPPETQITISAQLLDASSQEPDEAGETEETPKVRICVHDSGHGIPPSEVPLLFGKFVRLKRDLVGNVRGTGLGLYISKQLVEAMGGSIWVESTGVPGSGSCFYFTLPAASSTDVKEKTYISQSLAQSNNGVSQDGQKSLFLLTEPSGETSPSVMIEE